MHCERRGEPILLKRAGTRYIRGTHQQRAVLQIQISHFLSRLRPGTVPFRFLSPDRAIAARRARRIRELRPLIERSHGRRYGIFCFTIRLMGR